MNSTSYETQFQFSRALKVVRSMPINSRWQPPVNDKLQLYGLYKQATEGDCIVPKPSSRDIVRLAKWKAWDQLRHLSPIDAQKQYILLLIDLLTDFIRRYPQNELTPSLKEALQYVQMEGTLDNEDEYINKIIDHETGLLHHIEEHEIGDDIKQNHRKSKPTYSTTSSTSNYTYPLTPELSPNQQEKLKQQWYERNRSYIQQNQSSHSSLKHLNATEDFDTFSEADTIDREVAAATSGLGLVSPEQHPYNKHQPYSMDQKLKRRLSGQQQQNNDKASHKSSSSIHSDIMLSHSSNNRISTSERALESLQTEVAALTEQLEHLKLTLSEKEEKRRQYRWTWLWLTNMVLKQISINLIILFLIFLVLLKRKSPIAYAIIGYVGPNIRNILIYMKSKLFVWKVTV
ncbi:unnamed protein product [Cunninghamella blakesleeana]